MAYMSIGEIGQLADGAMKEVTVNGHEILVAKVGNSLYAADGRCPHMGASWLRVDWKGP